jgi:two-component system, LytTR family, response regulator
MPKLDDLSTNGRPPESHYAASEEGLTQRQAEILPDTHRLIIKSSRRLVFLDTAEIEWIEASGNYVRFHMGAESYVARAGIGRIAERLNQTEFVRIHRSKVVNIGKIKELETCENGEYIVILKGGTKLSSSRGYCSRLQQMIKRGYAF